MKAYSNKQRLAGVLLHPTSLPSGCLNDDVYRWLDLLSNCEFRVWQVLPFGPPQLGRSPYMSLSAFATNPELLPQDYRSDPDPDDEVFQTWCHQEHFWLDDYALFINLKQHFNQQAWCHWPKEYKYRDTDSLATFSQVHNEALLEIRWQQFNLYQRWQEICQYAADRDIYLFGDMSLFVSHDSADVWACRQRFLLDDNGFPTVLTGVPPDYFSATGQFWKNPHYDWNFMIGERFEWWKQRISQHLRWFDLIRIDHFRGLQATWMIDAASDTAADGCWQKTPGDELLLQLQQELGELPLVAEDLGHITPEVTVLRKKYKLSGMSVMQFSFDEFEDNPHKPQNIEADRIAYTGTHDNDTTQGWFNSLAPHQQTYVLQQLGITNADTVVDTFISQIFQSKAHLAILPLQDMLQLGSECRMNTPGTTERNWNWQFSWEQITEQHKSRIQQQVVASHRTGRVANG